MNPLNDPSTELPGAIELEAYLTGRERETGLTPEESLKRDMQLLADIAMKTTECLDPIELAQMEADQSELAEERVQHASGCEFCQLAMQSGRAEEER